MEARIRASAAWPRIVPRAGRSSRQVSKASSCPGAYRPPCRGRCGECRGRGLGPRAGHGEYLETHARRVYGATDAVDIIAAEAILARIWRGDLQDNFSCRDVHQRDWSRLTDRNHVQRGIDLLVDLDHLAADASSSSVGRPKVTYRINPASKR